MRVLKFGGTSVADEAAIERLAAIVRREVQRDAEAVARRTGRPGVAVIVSALGGATDCLLAIADRARRGETYEGIDLLESLRLRHLAVSRVIGDAELQAAAVATLEQQFEQLRAIVVSLAVLREVAPRSLDALAAAGELASSRIVAAALAARGLPAAWVDPRSLLVTDEAFTAASPLMAETTARIAAELTSLFDASRIPVTGGFVGATRAGITTTLGRGGSDYSASIIGAAIDADEIQIWTDVDGMLTADPRVHPAPLLVPHLSFAEAAELAYFGAKVLHPKTIQPALAREIPVRILNSRRADGDGTLITAQPEREGLPVTAFACKRQVTVVDVTSTRMLETHGFLRRLFEVFERHQTSVDVVTTSEVSVSVSIDDCRRLDAIVADLASFAEVVVHDGLALLGIVGDHLQADPATFGRIVAAIGRVPLRLVSQAASRRNVTIVIPEAELSGAVARLHDEFFGQPLAIATPGAPLAGARSLQAGS